MNIGISMEMTRKLRDTWHAALNHEWYDFLKGHRIIPLSCYDTECYVDNLDLVILTGGNDMPGIKTWRDNHYPLRDEYEKKLIESCWDRSLPVVGICRGSHFINYISGGTHVRMENPYDGVKVKLSNGFLNNFEGNLSDMLELETEWLTHKYDNLIQLSKDDKKRLDNLKLRNTE